MIGTSEILIIIFLFFLVASKLPFFKRRSKKFKVIMLVIFLSLASTQLIQNYMFKKDKTELLNSIKSVESGNNEIITQSKRTPVIDLELEHSKDKDYLYIVNNGLGSAYDVQILPSYDKLNQKHIASLSNKDDKKLIGTLSFNEYAPSTEIRVAVYFRDSSSIYYHWEFLIDRSGIHSVLRQHFNKLPDG